MGPGRTGVTDSTETRLVPVGFALHSRERGQQDDRLCAVGTCPAPARQYFALPEPWEDYLRRERRHYTIGWGEIPTCTSHATDLSRYWMSGGRGPASVTAGGRRLPGDIRACLLYTSPSPRD